MRSKFVYSEIILYFCNPFPLRGRIWILRTSLEKLRAFDFSSVRVFRVKLCQQLKLKCSDKIAAFVVRFPYAETHSFKIECKSTKKFRHIQMYLNCVQLYLNNSKLFVRNL